MSNQKRLEDSGAVLWALAAAEARPEHAHQVEMLRITRPFTYNREAQAEEQARTAAACRRYTGLMHDTHNAEALADNLDNTNVP